MDPTPSSHSQERYSYNPTLRWNPEVEDYFNKAYGADHFARISEALTRPSRYTCVRVNTLKSTTDAIIQNLTAILHEKGHATRNNSLNVAQADSNVGPRGCIDQGGFTKGPYSFGCDDEEGSIGDDQFPIDNSQGRLISKCQLPDMDYVLFVKGSGPHIFDYGGTTDQPLKEVIVSRKCAEAVLRGAQVFVPGVLACSAHVENGDKVAISVAVEQPLSDNEWAVGITRGIVLQGINTDPLYDERKGLYIGQGTAMLSRAGIFRASQGIAVELTDRVYRLLSFHDVLPGEIFLQNLPSIITAHVLDPQQGERILDMCAAPGGKTTAIAILMKDKGEIVAVDRSHNKVMDILNRAEEMGLTCIRAFRLNALKAVRRLSTDIDVTEDINSNNYLKSVGYPYKEEDVNPVDSQTNNIVSKKSSINKGHVRSNTSQMKNGPGRNHGKGIRTETSKGFFPCTFDRVLLDAPCSALGLRPRLFAGEETLESLQNHAKYQRKMFDQAVQLVRPGGIIVYSTCTINPGENEALVRYALDKYKFLSLAPQHPKMGGPGLIGQSESHDGTCIEKWLSPNESELVQRFDPSSSLDTIGFFIAKFILSQEGIFSSPGGSDF